MYSKRGGNAKLFRFIRVRENKVHLAVASSASKRLIESNLKIAGIRYYFEAIVSGAEVENGKPAPDIFLLAAEKIKCRPEECYVFEDSPNGIRAGYAAGCKAIMIPDLTFPTAEMQRLSFGIYDTLIEAMNKIRENFGTDYF